MDSGALTSFISRGIAPKYDDAGPGIVINQKCVRNGRLSLGPARHQSKEVPKDKAVRIWDVLINSTGEGTLGRVAQIQEGIANCTVDSHLTIVRPHEKSPRPFRPVDAGIEEMVRGLQRLDSHLDQRREGDEQRRTITASPATCNWPASPNSPAMRSCWRCAASGSRRFCFRVR